MRVRRGVALSAVVLAVVGVLVPAVPTVIAAPTSSGSTPHVGWINITATADYGYSPPYFQQVPTNATITVTFTDGSDLPHTFTIIGREGWVVPTNYNPAQIDSLAYGNSPPNLDNANVSGAGAVNVTKFESPGPGWYEFLCTVSGHFQLGMYGFVAFGMNLPSNITGVARSGIGGHLTFNAVDAAIIAAVAVVAVGGYLHIRRRQQRERFGQ